MAEEATDIKNTEAETPAVEVTKRKGKGGPASPSAARKGKFPAGKKPRPSAKPKFAKKKPSSRKR